MFRDRNGLTGLDDVRSDSQRMALPNRRFVNLVVAVLDPFDSDQSSHNPLHHDTRLVEPEVNRNDTPVFNKESVALPLSVSNDLRRVLVVEGYAEPSSRLENSRCCTPSRSLAD